MRIAASISGRGPALTVALVLLAMSGALHAQSSSPSLSPELEERLARASAKADAIAQRAGRVADINAIRNLQRIFGYYVDEAQWDQVADLFAENATLEIAGYGVFVGKPSIRRYLLSLTGGRVGLTYGQLNNHFQLSPVITLSADGTRAKGRWRVLMQTAERYEDESGGNWGSGVYENEYVKEDGVWKIQKLQLFVRFYVPYRDGWTRADSRATLRYGRSGVRPDRPTTFADYAPYPARYVAPFHFEHPVRSGYRAGPPPASAAGDTAAARAGSLAELEARVRALELEVQRLQAHDQIERLQSMYGYYADKNMQDATSALFAEDATLEILGRGVFVGLDRIYEYMRRLGAPAPGSLFNHMQLQPVVHVDPDGNGASVRSRLFVMFAAQNRAAQWGEGVYENRFIRENGVWKYRNLLGFQTFYTNYEDGWAKKASPIFAPFPGYPPDQPQSVAYDPYPAVFVPPYHYRNPVTGR
jgi:hypothetical protein|nr:MAG: hypothetical protein DIU56_06795 [Pseudomonadota bacterium]